MNNFETGSDHARMWFASIWAYTLGLPWTLGADFFLRHLLDGDPASNTLSWRWVVGLQTRGKTYLARAANIAKYTGGRFDPADLLARRAPPVNGPEAPPPAALSEPAPVLSGVPTALLLHEDDLVAAHVPLPAPGCPVAAFSALDGRSPLPAAPAPRAFTRGALDDALAIRTRDGAGSAWNAGDATVDALSEWARASQVRQVLTPWAPVGPARTRLDALEATLDQDGITLVRVRRDWDTQAWPHARRGFFPFRKHIPALLRAAGLDS